MEIKNDMTEVENPSESWIRRRRISRLWISTDEYRGHRNLSTIRTASKIVCIFKDKAVYEGPIIDRMMNGFGKMTEPNKMEYIGHFRDNIFDGIGKKTIYKDGKIAEERKGLYRNGVHIGTIKKIEKNSIAELDYDVDNKDTGHFRIEYISGDVYIGHVKNGQYDGFGKLICNGSSYEGFFSSGKKHGSGKLICGEHEQIGQFEEDRYIGCIKIVRDGNEELVDSLELMGTYDDVIRLFQNGDEYRGGWRDNRFEGYGVLRAGSSTYKGYFKNGKFDGRGCLTDDRSVKDGFFSKGAFVGEIYYHMDGVYVQPERIDGRYSGLMKQINADGTGYAGNVIDMKHHGIGRITEKDGTERILFFIDGEPVGSIEEVKGYRTEKETIAKIDPEMDFSGMCRLTYDPSSVFLGIFDRYTGLYADNAFNGRGKFTSDSSDLELITILENNRFTEKSRLVKKDRFSITGLFKNNLFEGRLKYVSSERQIEIIYNFDTRKLRTNYHGDLVYHFINDIEEYLSWIKNGKESLLPLLEYAWGHGSVEAGPKYRKLSRSIDEYYETMKRVKKEHDKKRPENIYDSNV